LGNSLIKVENAERVWTEEIGDEADLALFIRAVIGDLMKYKKCIIAVISGKNTDVHDEGERD